MGKEEEGEEDLEASITEGTGHHEATHHTRAEVVVVSDLTWRSWEGEEHGEIREMSGQTSSSQDALLLISAIRDMRIGEIDGLVVAAKDGRGVADVGAAETVVGNEDHDGRGTGADVVARSLEGRRREESKSTNEGGKDILSEEEQKWRKRTIRELLGVKSHCR